MTVLLTVPEVVARLRVSRRTVERLIATGELRATRVGRRTLVSETDLDTYVRTAGRRAAR